MPTIVNKGGIDASPEAVAAMPTTAHDWDASRLAGMLHREFFTQYRAMETRIGRQREELDRLLKKNEALEAEVSQVREAHHELGLSMGRRIDTASRQLAAARAALAEAAVVLEVLGIEIARKLYREMTADFQAAIIKSRDAVRSALLSGETK